MKSVNSLINTIKNRISNNDSVKKIEEATNKILHREDKECSYCNDSDNKKLKKIDELNKMQIVQPSSSSIFNRSDDIYHLFRPQDNLNSYDSALIMRNVDKCKGTNENIKNSKRIQLYKNKGDISNFNTTIRTNLNKFKIDLSKDLRYKFLNKYGAEDDFNFDIYIFPPPTSVQNYIDSKGYGLYFTDTHIMNYERFENTTRTIKSYSPPKKETYHGGATTGERPVGGTGLTLISEYKSNGVWTGQNGYITREYRYLKGIYEKGQITYTLLYNMLTGTYSESSDVRWFGDRHDDYGYMTVTETGWYGSTSGH